MKAIEILKKTRAQIEDDHQLAQMYDYAIAELEALKSVKRCMACSGTLFEDTLLREGTWMGTKPLPSEFFRKSEFDFGWDYYPRQDTLQSKCKNCGYISYSVPKDPK